MTTKWQSRCDSARNTIGLGKRNVFRLQSLVMGRATDILQTALNFYCAGA